MMEIPDKPSLEYITKTFGGPENVKNCLKLLYQTNIISPLHCPHCHQHGNENECKMMEATQNEKKKKFKYGYKWKCPACNNQYHITKNTIMEGCCKITPYNVIMIVYLHSLRVDTAAIAQMIGMCL